METLDPGALKAQVEEIVNRDQQKIQSQIQEQKLKELLNERAYFQRLEVEHENLQDEFSKTSEELEKTKLELIKFKIRSEVLEEVLDKLLEDPK